MQIRLAVDPVGVPREAATTEEVVAMEEVGGATGTRPTRIKNLSRTRKMKICKEIRM